MNTDMMICGTKAHWQNDPRTCLMSEKRNLIGMYVLKVWRMTDDLSGGLLYFI